MTPVKTADGKLENFILEVAKKPFRCPCGCNVFHKPDDQNLLIYRCNACEETYEAS